MPPILNLRPAKTSESSYRDTANLGVGVRQVLLVVLQVVTVVVTSRFTLGAIRCDSLSLESKQHDSPRG